MPANGIHIISNTYVPVTEGPHQVLQVLGPCIKALKGLLIACAVCFTITSPASTNCMVSLEYLSAPKKKKSKIFPCRPCKMFLFKSFDKCSFILGLKYF